jgi:GT2 family glycosyltransferase
MAAASQHISTSSAGFDVDVIIIHRNTLAMTSACIESIFASSIASRVRVIVVDNDSHDDSAKELEQAFAHITVVRAGENLGYGKACNLGARHGTSPFVIFSNSDVLYTHTAIERLVSTLAKHRNCAVCGPQQFFPDGSWQQSYDHFPGVHLALRNLFGLSALFRHRQRKRLTLQQPERVPVPLSVPFLDGAVLAVRRVLFEEIDGFDERYFFFCEDVELSYAFHRAGYGVLLDPSALVIHERGFTRRRSLQDDLKYLGANERARAFFLRSHHGTFATRMALVIGILHYGVITVVLWLFLLISPAGKRDRLRHRITVVQHLIAVCANELEKSP